MEITPPVSPREDDPAPDVALLKTGDLGFECVGAVAKGTQFHPEGFILSGEALLFTNYRSICSRKDSCFSVFQHYYEVDNVNQEDLTRLFNIAKSRLCVLDAAQKLNVGAYGGLTGKNPSNFQLNYIELRKDLRQFFMMLRYFIAVECSKDEFMWIIEDMLPSILCGLSLLRAQLGWLTDLPSYVLNHAQTSGCGAKSTAQVAFHLFHCHLDLRWLHITTLWQLLTGAPNSKVLNTTQMSQAILPQAPQGTIVDFNLKNQLYSAVQLCLTDLLKMSVNRFNQLSHEEMMYTSAFNCMCVKELWLLLRFLIEQIEEKYDEKMTFWGLIDNLLHLVVGEEKKSDASGNKIVTPHRMTSTSIICTDPNLFTVWLLRHLAEIYKYDSCGYQLDSFSTMISSNHGTLKRILNHMTDASVTLTEWQRRVLVTLVRVLITDLWEAKPELIMMLWDCFYRSLDSAFQLPGAGAESYAVMSQTARGMLESVKKLHSSKPTKSMNSYELFLHLLGQYLQQNPLHWKQKMRGRVYSKLTTRKVDSLSEMGLYHLVQLFLTVAIQTDMEDVTATLQDLLKLSHTSGKKNSIMMRAHLSMVLLRTERGLPLGPLLKPLTLVVSHHLTCSQSDHLTCRQMTVPRMFVEALEDVMSSNVSLQLDQHLLVGEWLEQYLMHNRPDASRLVLNKMLSVMKKLRTYAAQDYGSIGEGTEKLVSSLREHLLPYVKEQMSNNLSPPFEVADVAVQFTLLSLEFAPTQPGRGQRPDSFSNLLHLFVMGDSVNIYIVRRYLCLLLSDGVVLNLSGQTSEQQLVLIQAWMRCSIQCSELDNQEMRKITQSVFQLPLMQSLLSNDGTLLERLMVDDDPFCSLLEYMGDTFQNQKRKECNNLLEPIGKWIHTLKTRLFPPKSKDTDQKQEHMLTEVSKDVTRVFHVLGKLTFNCGKIIFEKNTNSCLLVQIVTGLLMPTVVYNMDVRLPAAMDEALRQSLLLFLRGLHQLDPSKDMAIKRFMWDLVVVYVPRMSVHPGMLECGSQTNPFIKIWDEPEYMSAATATIQIVCDKLLLLDKKTNLPHKHYVQGLRLIRDLVQRHNDDDMLISVMIEKPLPNMLEVVAKVNDLSAHMKLKETESTIRHIFQSKAYLTHPTLWEQTNVVLTNLSKKYLCLNPDIFSRVVNFLVKDFRPVIKKFLPELKVHLAEAIRKRGAGNDKRLQLILEKLEMAVNS